MKNTGIIYDSTERMCTVLPEFAELLPPLSEEQLSALETDILQNGCYAPVIVNENLEIVDGHNRFTLCEKHGLPYKIAVFHFEDRLEAKQWALDTQKARRNLTAWELGQIALKMKPDIEARARENMSAGGGDQKSEAAKSGLANSPNPIFSVNTREQLAQAAGIGSNTMGRIMKIDEQAPEPVKDALDKKEISVNQGYEITRQVQGLPPEEQEQAAAQLIERKKARKEMEEKDAEIEQKSRVAKTFCAAFEKAILVRPTEENVRIWIYHTGVRPEQLDGLVSDAREISEDFARIAELIETKIKPTDWRNTVERGTEQREQNKEIVTDEAPENPAQSGT